MVVKKPKVKTPKLAIVAPAVFLASSYVIGGDHGAAYGAVVPPKQQLPVVYIATASASVAPVMFNATGAGGPIVMPPIYALAVTSEPDDD